ncbi:MAG: LysR family transcriptional regulator [Marivita sp.]|uniref:LysR family transcriptional regulator n=1 Tax=Marivita sp. TaxID=2003365 RepID=UPI003EF2FEDD
MIDWSRLPSLAALRAFCAFVERGSVVGAGAALNVSHAAVSQQLRSLETHLGTPLFDRSNRALELTDEGRDLARALEDGFGRINTGVLHATQSRSERPLNIACTPTFAAAWLMPRLAGFQSAHPGIDMVLTPSPALTDPAFGGIDVALRFGEGPWPGFDHVCLMSAPIVAVAAPELIKDATIHDPEALLAYPWLEELGTTESTSWLAAQGLAHRRVKSRTELPGNLMLDAARRGQGIAVTTWVAVAEDVAAGRLVILFRDRPQAGYHMLTKPGVLRPPLRAFVRWIRKEAAKS